MTKEEIIKELEERERECKQFLYLKNRESYEQMLIWNDFIIMKALKFLLEKE